MADGGWEEITSLYNAHFSAQTNKKALAKWYTENMAASQEQSTVRKGSLTAEELAWLVETVRERLSATGQMPHGGWAAVAREFKQQFGFAKPQRRLQEVYYAACQKDSAESD